MNTTMDLLKDVWMQTIRGKSVKVQPMNKIIVMLLLVTSSIVPFTITNVEASSKSPYESGYDHAQDDCGLDTEDRYINQPGKGPSHHTERFMDGYNAGIADCDNGDDDGSGNGDSDPNSGSSSSRGSVNWENLCIRFGDRIDISSNECSRYADGTQLTQAGEDFLVCNLIARVGPMALGLDVAGIGVGSLLAELC